MSLWEATDVQGSTNVTGGRMPGVTRRRLLGCHPAYLKARPAGELKFESGLSRPRGE